MSGAGSMVGLGGLPRRRPDQSSQPPPAPISPGSGNIVRARIVIITGGAGSGIFVYSPSPGAGNLIGSWAGSGGTDPYGNAYPAGLSVDLGAISGTTISGSVITGSEFEGSQFVLDDDGLFLYSAPSSSGPLLGSNSGNWATQDAAIIAAGGTQMLAYRGYDTPGNGVPPAWPGGGAAPIPAGVTLPVISFWPPGSSQATADVAGMIAGTYDAQLAAFFAAIPAGANARVTVAAEGEAGRFPWSVTQIQQLHAHVQPIFAANAPPDSQYWQCVTYFTEDPTSGHYPLGQWISPVVQGVGIDFYNAGASMSGLTAAAAAIQAAVPGMPMAIWECNSQTEADRPSFFSGVEAWAKANGAEVICTFFSSSPYVWDGSDTATISALESINEAGGTGTAELVGSVAPVAGTDPVTGSAYPAGVAVGKESTGQALLNPGLTLTSIGFFSHPSNIKSISLVNQAVAVSPPGDEPALMLSCVITYTNNETAPAQILLGAASASGLTTFLMNVAFSSGASTEAWQCSGTAQYGGGGTTISLGPTEFLAFDPAGNASAILVGKLNNSVAPYLGLYAVKPGSNVVPPAPSAWSALSPGASWTNSGAGPDLQYRLIGSPPNEVEIIGDLTPGTQTDGTVIATLPISLWPQSTQTINIRFPGATGSMPAAARFSVNTTGQLQCEGISGVTTTRISFRDQISLDA